VNRFIKNRINPKKTSPNLTALNNQDILLSKKTVRSDDNITENKEVYTNVTENNNNKAEIWVKKNYNKGDCVFVNDIFGNLKKYRCEINHTVVFYDKFSKGEFIDYYINKDKKIFVWVLIESSANEIKLIDTVINKRKIDRIPWAKDYYNEGDYVLINIDGEKLYRCEKSHGPEFYDNFGNGEFIEFYEQNTKKIFFWCLVEDLNIKSTKIAGNQSSQEKINGIVNKKYLFDIISDYDLSKIDDTFSDFIKSNNKNFIDLFYFKRFISDKKIVLVANSSKLIGARNGSYIDSHDIVVRFNSFKINPIDTGSKTSIHASIYLNDINLDKYVPIRFILSLNKDKWLSTIKNIDNKNQGLFLKCNHHRDIFLNKKHDTIVTTGFSFILLLMRIGGFKELTLFGFDFYENGVESIYRTEDGMNLGVSKVHNYNEEKIFVTNNFELIDKENCIYSLKC
jgi:hypothetical protein